MAFAGIWAGWRGERDEVVRSFAIITAEANKLMAPVHNRMPVIVEEADWPVWRGETKGDPASLLRPTQEDVLRLWPVGPAVNNVRNDGLICWTPPDALPSPRGSLSVGSVVGSLRYEIIVSH